jgi:hypothetical protein
MPIDREKRFLYNSKKPNGKLQIGFPARASGNNGEERIVKTPDGKLRLYRFYEQSAWTDAVQDAFTARKMMLLDPRDWFGGGLGERVRPWKDEWNVPLPWEEGSPVTSSSLMNIT